MVKSIQLVEKQPKKWFMRVKTDKGCYCTDTEIAAFLGIPHRQFCKDIEKLGAKEQKTEPEYLLKGEYYFDSKKSAELGSKYVVEKSGK